MQLWNIPTRPVTGSQWEELSTSLSASPPLEAVESNEVTPQPPVLQTRGTQSPQPLLIRHALQPFHQLCCPPLNASFLHCWAQNCTEYSRWGCTSAKYSRIIISSDHHVIPYSTHWTPFCRAAFQLLLSQFIIVSSGTPSQVQNPAFVLVKFHAIEDCTMLQRISIPLQGLLSLEGVNSTSEFSIISKFTNGAFNFCIQIIDKNIEQNWP